MAAAKKAPRKTPKRATRSRKPAAARGPEPKESILEPTGKDVAALVEQVGKQGGVVVGAYRDPFAGQALVLASLPIKKVVATPFQRDLSKTHATRRPSDRARSGRSASWKSTTGSPPISRRCKPWA